jgi:hypothetical protein
LAGREQLVDIHAVEQLVPRVKFAHFRSVDMTEILEEADGCDVLCYAMDVHL